MLTQHTVLVGVFTCTMHVHVAQNNVYNRNGKCTCTTI